MSATLAPEKILSELAALWVDLDKQGHSESRAGVLRACSMTLVALADDCEDFGSLGETIAALMPEHPARAIVVRMCGEGEHTLAERVYAQCWKPFGQRRQICCEQVEIRASDSAMADLPSVVLPLAVADLPLILWCRSPRILGMPAFVPIASMAQKVVLDSAGMRDAKTALARIADVAKRGILIGDLSWTQLTRWREMLSQVFENRSNVGQVSQVARVTVTVSGEPPVSAWYLGAWVMDALADAGVRPEFHIERETDDRVAGLRSVELSGEAFRVELALHDERMVTTVNGLCHCTNWPPPTDYLLLREELGIVRRDPGFERTLESAARLAGARE